MDSIWTQTLPPLPDFPPLEGDISCEAAVVGGGMAGILTAWELKRRGVETVVLEAGQPGAGVTAGTTAKITSQHGMIYHNLIRAVGAQRAGQYAAANQAAISDYEALVGELGIGCAFRRAPAYLYDRKSDAALKKEAAAANSLNIPAVLVKDTELPFPVAGALKFPEQAQFQPLAFLAALLSRLKIYGHTTAEAITDEGVRTGRGFVKARHVLVCTHFPFFNLPGFYFARMHQDRSYVLALQGPPALEGMYRDADPAGLSLRSGEGCLLLGGGGHRSGKTPGEDGYKTLERAAGRWWPQAKIAARWSAQDCMTMDGVPYIGAYPGGRANLYVATGFQKWGMSTAMAAAHILSDLVTGRDNPYAQVFSPHRLPTFPALSNLLKDGGMSAGHLLSQAFYTPRAQLRDVKPGQGGVVSWHGKKVGVYHGEDGRYYLVPTRCPHLGCQLSWNAAERTWDCPCHGSRFDHTGRRLDAPASDDLSCRLRRDAQ